ncbi:hypothetical protein HY479_00825 [Candidatus Uhrbacteria bacterium]|nr:hypothetical protein [Candidatus Uhrbacteria bacterium]
MAKLKSYPTKAEPRRRISIRINVREIERKIRKPHAPPTKVHATKKQYRRKAKHRKPLEE